MLCVSFVLMKMKSHFKFLHSLLRKVVKKRLSLKNTHTFYLLPSYLIILSICVCSLSRLSRINAKTREMCARRICQNLSEFVWVYANDKLCCEAFVWLFKHSAMNQILLNEVKWDEIKKYNFKGNNEHGPWNWAQKTALRLAILLNLSQMTCQHCKKKIQNSKPTKFCQQNQINSRLFGDEQKILLFHCWVFRSISFYNVEWAKSFTSREKIQRFVTPERGKIARLCFHFLSLPLSLSLPLLSTFVEIFNEYMNFPFVFLKSTGHATSRRRRVNLSMAFHNGLHGGGRTDKQSDSDVITKTKIFRIHGFTKFS